MTQVLHYPTPTSAEDTAAHVIMHYDADYYGNSDKFTLGRMTWRQYTINGYAFLEQFGYRAAGQLGSKSLRITSGYNVHTLGAAWGYDNEGRVTAVGYPGASLKQDGTGYIGGQLYTYGYDVMGRLATMTSTVSPNLPTNIVTGTTYGPAGELLTVSMAGRATETRSYNSLLQLTSLDESTFTYAPGQNNGRIQSETNTVTGEQITYQYDALSQLISAVTSDNPNVTQWGKVFGTTVLET